MSTSKSLEIDMCYVQRELGNRAKHRFCEDDASTISERLNEKREKLAKELKKLRMNELMAQVEK